MFSISSTSRIEACSSKGTDNFREPESCQVASMPSHATWQAMIPWFHAWWSIKKWRQQEAFQRFPEISRESEDFQLEISRTSQESPAKYGSAICEAWFHQDLAILWSRTCRPPRTYQDIPGHPGLAPREQQPASWNYLELDSLGIPSSFYSFPVTSRCTKTGSFYRGEPPTCTSPWQVVKKTIMIWQTTSTWHVKHVKNVKKVVWATVRIRQVRDEERMRKDVSMISMDLSSISKLTCFPSAGQGCGMSACNFFLLCYLKL